MGMGLWGQEEAGETVAMSSTSNQRQEQGCVPRHWLWFPASSEDGAHPPTPRRRPDCFLQPLPGDCPVWAWLGQEGRGVPGPLPASQSHSHPGVL